MQLTDFLYSNKNLHVILLLYLLITEKSAFTIEKNPYLKKL